ncbi:MAG: DUF134 domain-containing protein [Planctomycetes bacterium]|nr:DUF134 domain-containing protein [Planctomycetota bacterium]
MPRPFKCRQIGCKPDISYFKPRGIPVTRLEEVILTMDEFESVRLADLEGMYQDDAAKKMNSSRQTFGNIVNSARKKIAEALVKGKAIKIKGGIYQIEGVKKFKCCECEHRWEFAYGIGRPPECPKCQSNNIQRNRQDCGYAKTNKFRQEKRKCRRIPL